MLKKVLILLQVLIIMIFCYDLILAKPPSKKKSDVKKEQPLNGVEKEVTKTQVPDDSKIKPDQAADEPKEYELRVPMIPFLAVPPASFLVKSIAPEGGWKIGNYNQDNLNLRYVNYSRFDSSNYQEYGYGFDFLARYDHFGLVGNKSFYFGYGQVTNLTTVGPTYFVLRESFSMGIAPSICFRDDPTGSMTGSGISFPFTQIIIPNSLRFVSNARYFNYDWSKFKGITLEVGGALEYRLGPGAVSVGMFWIPIKINGPHQKFYSVSGGLLF